MRRAAAFAALLLILCVRDANAGLRFGGETLRDKINEMNTVGGVGEALPCSAATADGQVHYTDTNEANDCDGDEGFTFTESTNLVNINEATDGDFVAMVLQNDLANAAASTNETAQLKFGFGSNTDVARIVAGKVNDYSTSNDECSHLSLYLDDLGTAREFLRGRSECNTALTGSYQTIIGAETSTFAPNNDAILEVQAGANARNSLLFGVYASGGPQAFIVSDSAPTATFGGLGAGSVAQQKVDIDASTNVASMALYGSSTHGVPSSLTFGHHSSGSTYTVISTLSAINNAVGTPATFDDAKWITWSFADFTGVDEERPLIFFGEETSSVATAINITSGSTISQQRDYHFYPSHMKGVAGGATETVTDFATVYIAGAAHTTDATVTNNYALWVDDQFGGGKVRFDGAVSFNTTTNQGDITIQKADPTLIYDVTTATDTDFWAGVTDDGGNDDDDKYQIGDGTTPGSNVHVTVLTDGSVGLGNTAPSPRLVVDFPTAQTIAAGNTVAADACGSIKLISSAGAVTTDTTNTFTAPAAGNKGCIMHVVNSGANNITLDNNANFKSAGAADVVMTPDDAVVVGSTGAGGVWYQLTGLVAN